MSYKVLNIPLTFKDKVERKVGFKASAQNVDSNKYLVRSKTFNPEFRNISIVLNIDFEEREVIYDYVDSINIITTLGGLKKAFSPFLNFFAPIMILQFLVHLSKVISMMYKNQYRYELERTVKLYYDELKLIENKLSLSNQ